MVTTYLIVHVIILYKRAYGFLSGGVSGKRYYKKKKKIRLYIYCYVGGEDGKK